MSTMTPDEAKVELFAAVTAIAVDGLMRYYQEHPERIGDARAADAHRWSMEGLARILAKIAEYHVEEGPQRPSP